MSLGLSCLRTGYFELAISIISVMNGTPSASEFSDESGMQKSPPASFLICVICCEVMNSAATIISVSRSLLSLSKTKTIFPFLRAFNASCIIGNHSCIL